MIRQILLLLLAAVGGAIAHKYWSVSQHTEADAISSPRKAPTSRIRVAKLDLEKASLRDALYALADSAHASLAADWEHMDYQKDMSVTLHLNNVSLDDAMQAIFKANTRGYLSYSEQGGVIFVSSREKHFDPRVVETRVYDVRDLVADYAKYDLRPGLPEYEWQRGPQLDDYHQAIYLFWHELAWRINEENSYNEFDELAGRLIITTDRESHRPIAALLARLRQASKWPGGLNDVLALYNSPDDEPYKSFQSSHAERFGPPSDMPTIAGPLEPVDRSQTAQQ